MCCKWHDEVSLLIKFESLTVEVVQATKVGTYLNLDNC